MKRNLKIITGILISIVGVAALFIGVDFTDSMINFLFIALFGFEFVQWFAKEDDKKEENKKALTDEEFVEKVKELLKEADTRGVLEEIMWFDEEILENLEAGLYEEYGSDEK